MTTNKFTAVIFGGGPAGCQCALWLKMLGFAPLIIETSDHLGGLQAMSPYQNQWIAGTLDTNGRELAARIQQHIKQKDIPVLFKTKVDTVAQHDGGFVVDAGGRKLETRFIVIASGSAQQKDDASAIHDQHAHDAAFAAQQPDAGWRANLPAALASFKDKLLNQDGFIKTNAVCETPVAGIFAIGEAANRMHPCVVTSMADGVVAAKAIQDKIG